MSKKQKLVLILIIISVIVIISILLLLQLIIKRQEFSTTNNSLVNNNNYINEGNVINNDIYYNFGDPDEKLDEGLILRYVDNRATFFCMKNITVKYFTAIYERDTDTLKDIVSNNYFKSNKLEQLLTYQQLKDTQFLNIIITQMIYSQVSDYEYVYIIKGNIRVSDTNDKNQFNIMVLTNEQNNLYVVYPEKYLKDNKYNELKQGNYIKGFSIEQITENINNKLIYNDKADRDIVNEYFNSYKEIILYYPEYAYGLLDKNYASKRFGNYENFNSYLKERNYTLSTMQVKNYSVSYEGESINYSCVDQYNNYYLFKQNGRIMNYSVFLDNYTIMQDKNLKEYNSCSKFDKAKYNLNKFINMINTKDYKSIYDVLDATFKDNNFKNIEALKSYINDNMYNNNSIEIVDYDDEKYEYYVFKCKLINQSNKDSVKYMNVIINQTDGSDFTMSFSF